MKPKFYSLTFLFGLGALVLINAASSLYVPAVQDVTLTPTTSPTISVTGPAGNTNGIAFLGILIFAVILIGIVVRLREARVS